MASLLQRIGNRDLLHRGAQAMVLKVLSSLCLLGFNLLVVHHYEPTLAGEFFLCITLVLVASQFIRFGMDNVLVKQVSVLRSSNDQQRLATLCSSALLITLIAGIALASLMYAAADWLAAALFSKPSMAPMLRLMALATPFYGVCLLLSYINQGLSRIGLHIASLNLGQVTLASLLLAGGVHLAGLPAGIELLAGSYVAGCALMMLYMLACTARQVQLGAANVRVDRVLPLVRESFPLFIVALTQLVMVWSSQLFLGAWASASDVAIYTIAQRVAMVTSFVLMAVNSVVAPRFAVHYHNGEMRQLEQLSRLSLRVMLLMATPLLVAMLLFPQPILSLFGSGYASAAPVLIILALGQFVNVVTGPVGYLLQMSGHYRQVRNNTALAALTAVGLNVMLTPQYGILGAAVAAAVALSVVNLLGLWQVRRLLGFRLAGAMRTA
ncbi:flippase [Parahaliea aestuarii]|uniref:Flippase n=1 Tax=Parahaliea aestuarii TaxID=1852021 RepID=A0A5C8ZS32_9GAMM|nr:flippase [Parahaliea aestuarii]TXS90470.1 flippase [Parahaliea aestuarii]